MNKRYTRRGFTLIELLVVVLIIGILAAIALPQYQKAVLKSRFAALMPIGKSMANSNEVYYLEHGHYADNAQDLPVQGQMEYPDGTEIEFGTTSEYAYVLATRGNDFPNNYVVYQKHSENFPGNIHCEALSTDEKAKRLCISVGGEYLGENGDYSVYKISGESGGSFQVLRKIENKGCNSYYCLYAFEDGLEVREYLSFSNYTDMSCKKQEEWVCYSSFRGRSVQEDLPVAEGGPWSSVYYDEEGNPYLRTLGNGKVSLYYDEVGRLSQIVTIAVNAGTSDYTWYYPDGSVMRAKVGDAWYVYHEDGTPYTDSAPARSSLSTFDTTQYGISTKYGTAKNKCILYPELPSCS